MLVEYELFYSKFNDTTGINIRSSEGYLHALINDPIRYGILDLTKRNTYCQAKTLWEDITIQLHINAQESKCYTIYTVEHR